MEIVLKIPVKTEVLEDVFVTALEGGSNYWYFLSDEAIAKIRAAVSKEEDEYLATAMLKAILEHDVQIAVNDAENEDEVIGVISKSTIQPRLQELVNSEYKWALEAHMSEHGDADSADIVFQYLAMGGVIYG